VPAAALLAADDPALRPSDDLADARAALEAADLDPDAEAHREAVLEFLDAHDDALHRSCAPGHLTGSALVVDEPGERVVVLHHRKLRRWLQPGGHCDGDANLAAVALREATEETGIAGLQVHPTAIDVDVHEVAPPAEGPHLHLDARFLVVAPAGAEPAGNHESTDIRWVTVDELHELGIDEGTARMVRHGLARHRELRGR
jgi:8-oxo-dGTP pyrophosphatase MutT (NUDIX family)